jgi:hypothetical protein
MPVTSGSRVQFEYMLGGGSPAIMSVPESYNSTGWDQGSVLLLDASGHLQNIATGSITTGCWGVALAPMAATADGSANGLVVLITPQTVFSAIVAHATTASAVSQATQRGNVYQLTSSATVCPSTNVRVIDVSSTTSIGAHILDFKDATGTAYGRVYFNFLGTYRAESPFGMFTSA